MPAPRRETDERQTIRPSQPLRSFLSLTSHWRMSKWGRLASVAASFNRRLDTADETDPDVRSEMVQELVSRFDIPPYVRSLLRSRLTLSASTASPLSRRTAGSERRRLPEQLHRWCSSLPRYPSRPTTLLKNSVAATTRPGPGWSPTKIATITMVHKPCDETEDQVINQGHRRA